VAAGQEANQHSIHDLLLADDYFSNFLANFFNLRYGVLQREVGWHIAILCHHVKVTSDLLVTHLDYTAWASRRLVDAAQQLTPEELTRDFGTSDHSVLGTLVHVFAADRVWLCRVTGSPVPARFVEPEKDMHLAVLQTEWPELLDRWKNWAAGITNTSAVISYRDMKGNAYESKVWQIVLHLVNHATHHRGQAAGFLRTMGRTPPVLDLIAYHRQLPQGQLPQGG
jgi:uncharacterized damage-inducible protein DinB